MNGFAGRTRARHPSHDFAGPGIWFLTIGTWGGLPVFGEVVDARLHLNDVGTTVQQCWAQIPVHFPNARTHDFVVMPNHLHALLALGEPAVQQPAMRVERFGAPVPGSVATVVRSFKAATTRLVRQLLDRPVLLWQPGVHDRRIRDAAALNAARRYIAKNPERWIDSHPRHEAVVRTITHTLVPVAVRGVHRGS